MKRRSFAIVPVLALLACGNAAVPSSETPTSSGNAPMSNSAGASDAKAEVGKAAPDFALKDTDGKDVKLSDYKGKIVVLEWFNPECPFVKAAHTKGSLVTAAKKHTDKGVVWLAVNSGGAGKQGAGADASKTGAKTFGLGHPVLIDEAGDVGKKYGATNTPHMMVIDDKGTLVYRGAIDNSPDGEAQSPTGGKLVNYVDEAVEAARGGKAPAIAETKAYGCGVKYGSK